MGEWMDGPIVDRLINDSIIGLMGERMNGYTDC
jgi:hypothetical protein